MPPGVVPTTTLPPDVVPTTTAPPGVVATTTAPPKRGGSWTSQDIRDHLNAGADYASLKKYHPYATNVQPDLPEFIPVDWRGQAAAFQSATNAAANQLGAYLPGQGMASNLSSLAGQQAENLGKAISGVDQYNAAGATNMNLQRANMLNQATMYNAQNADKMASEENVYDDRFRTAERLARKGIVKTRNQGEENASKIYNLNQVESPYYTIDPYSQRIQFNDANAKAAWEKEQRGGNDGDQDDVMLARRKKLMNSPEFADYADNSDKLNAIDKYLGYGTARDTPPAKKAKVTVDPVTKGNKTTETTYDEDGNPVKRFGGGIGASFVKSIADWHSKLAYINDPAQRQRAAEAYAHKMHFGK
jgi:hypothetical protein